MNDIVACILAIIVAVSVATVLFIIVNYLLSSRRLRLQSLQRLTRSFSLLIKSGAKQSATKPAYVKRIIRPAIVGWHNLEPTLHPQKIGKESQHQIAEADAARPTVLPLHDPASLQVYENGLFQTTAATGREQEAGKVRYLDLQPGKPAEVRHLSPVTGDATTVVIYEQEDSWKDSCPTTGVMTSWCASLIRRCCCVRPRPGYSLIGRKIETRLVTPPPQPASQTSTTSVQDADNLRTKRQSQLVIEYVVRLYAFAVSIYAVMMSTELFADVTTSETGHGSNTPLLLLLAVHTGLVVFRLALNAILHRPMCRPPDVGFLLVVYDVILALTLAFLVFGRMLDMLGAAILLSECAPLLKLENKEVTDEYSDDDDEEEEMICLSDMKSSESHATDDDDARPSSQNNCLRYARTTSDQGNKKNTPTGLESKLLSYLSSRHLRAIVDVTLVFMYKLLLPVLVLSVYINQRGLFSLSQLPLCVFSYSATFFCAFHLYALVHNVLLWRKLC